MEIDIERASLDILVLVSSKEFKNKEFIHDRHMMIKDLLNKQ